MPTLLVHLFKDLSLRVLSRRLTMIESGECSTEKKMGENVGSLVCHTLSNFYPDVYHSSKPFSLHKQPFFPQIGHLL